MMLKMILGFAFGVVGVILTGKPWIALLIYAVLGLGLQVAFTKRLYSHLGGIDPVKEFGAKSLKQLGAFVEIPLSVKVLDLLAKSFGYAIIVAILFAIGWLEIA